MKRLLLADVRSLQVSLSSLFCSYGLVDIKITCESVWLRSRCAPADVRPQSSLRDSPPEDFYTGNENKLPLFSSIKLLQKSPFTAESQGFTGKAMITEAKQRLNK